MVAMQLAGHERLGDGTDCSCGKSCSDAVELAEHLSDAHRRNLQPDDAALTESPRSL